MFEDWIRLQNSDIQIEVFSRISHFLSNSELVSIMEVVNSGVDIVSAHSRIGVLEKYQINIFRIREIITERYPDLVVG